MWRLQPYFNSETKKYDVIGLCERELNIVCDDLGLSSTTRDTLWERMEAFYIDDYHNVYHNFVHVAYCLNVWDTVYGKQMFPHDEPHARLALLLHDAGENPEETADYVKTFGASAYTAEIIRDTSHEFLPRTDLGRLVCDTDLHILGAAPAIFDQYCERVANEWRGCVTASQYARGRIRVLESFARRGVFNTDTFRNQFSLSAAYNINREIARLEKEL